MRQSRSFLVIADDSERLFLVSNTLHRKFPNSVVQTCRDASAAIEVARTQRLDAIVAHRSTELDEISLVQQLCAVTTAPIVAVTRRDQEVAALAAGASKQLAPEQWLLIGQTVGDLIGAHPP